MKTEKKKFINYLINKLNFQNTGVNPFKGTIRLRSGQPLYV